MGKKINVDFYRVNMPGNTQRSFQDLIEAIIRDKPLPSQRNVKSHDHYIRLQEIEVNSGLYLGNLVRIRMNDIPPVADLDGSVQDLALATNQGLGEETFFLYSPRPRILLLHRNGNGVRASGLAYYFEEIGGADPIELEPVMEPDILKKLASMEVIRSFNVRLAQPDNVQVFSGSGKSVSSFLDLMSEHAAAAIDVSLSMGRRRGTLSLETVKQQALKLLAIRRNQSKQVEKLIITGKRFEDEPTEPLDLIKGRITESMQVNELNRRISSIDCKEKLLQIYENRRYKLEEMYCPPDERA